MTRLFLQRPVATWVLFVALVVLGVYALPKLRVESMPEVELPSLTIRTSWTGASPSAVQRAITVPVEEAVRRVHGIEEITARSYPGISLVDVSFRRDVNVEFAKAHLKEAIGIDLDVATSLSSARDPNASSASADPMRPPVAEDRLTQLRALREKGLITEEEFAKKRQEILDEL